MSKENTFTHIGAETNKIISRILSQYSEDEKTIQKNTIKTVVLCNDNTNPFDWEKAKQLNLFDRAAVG